MSDPSRGGNGLAPFRRRLDELDEQIAGLLGERFQTCREIALYKREHEIPMMQPQRVKEVRARYLARGADVDLPVDFTESLFELLIGATCKMEDELIDGAGHAPSPSARDTEPHFTRKAPGPTPAGRGVGRELSYAMSEGGQAAPVPAQREVA